MKAGKKQDFLAGRGFAIGEFEELQALFDRSIDQLSTALCEPVGRGLRAQLAHEISDPYVTSAKQILDSMLSRLPAAGHREAASADLARRLRAELDSDAPLDDADIDREVRSCSREIAERVLARWFDKLHRALRESKSLRLNANLLPGTSSVEEMLAGIDFESHGVGKLIVVNGLRTYWETLARTAQDKQEPVQLGRRLFIVPDPSEADQPFILFSDGGEARERAKGKPAATMSMAVAPTREREREKRYLHLYRLVRTILAPPRPVFVQNELALGVFRTSMASKRTNQLVQWDSARMEAALFGEHPGPELVLMESVERGIDLFVAGLAAGEEAAGNLLGSVEGRIPQHLADYAIARDLPIDAVEDAFALAVCVGVEYQPMRYRPSNVTGSLLMGEIINFDPHRQFAQAHQVKQDDAVTLISAAFAGSALATPGAALP